MSAVPGNLPVPQPVPQSDPSVSLDRRAGERALFTAVVRGVSKEINSDQLKGELGGADVFTSTGPDGSVVVLANTSQAALDAAVSAHIAKNPRRDAVVLLKEKAKTDTTVAAMLDVLGIV